MLRLAPLPHLSFDLESQPAQSDVSVLEHGLFAYEEARLGDPEHGHFSIFVRDPVGRVRAGADCHAMWRRLFLKTLWVEEGLRRRGLGKRLMDSVEHEAVSRRCRSVWLTALGDPACNFYLKLGYRVFGTHLDYVAGQSLYSLRKDFG